jgi:hypothetical protein
VALVCLLVAVAVVAVQQLLLMELLVVLAHSLRAVAGAAVRPAQAFLPELVVLAVQDMWRSTHGKFIRRDRRWRCR